MGLTTLIENTNPTKQVDGVQPPATKAKPITGKQVGFDLDRTLAIYDTWRGVHHVGAPVLPMVQRIAEYLALGEFEVVIFTARWWYEEDRAVIKAAIDAFCMEHFGRTFEITNIKSPKLARIYDDIAVSVEANTGKILLPADHPQAQILRLQA